MFKVEMERKMRREGKLLQHQQLQQRMRLAGVNGGILPGSGAPADPVAGTKRVNDGELEGGERKRLALVNGGDTSMANAEQHQQHQPVSTVVSPTRQTHQMMAQSPQHSAGRQSPAVSMGGTPRMMHQQRHSPTNPSPLHQQSPVMQQQQRLQSFPPQQPQQQQSPTQQHQMSMLPPSHVPNSAQSPTGSASGGSGNRGTPSPHRPPSASQQQQQQQLQTPTSAASSSSMGNPFSQPFQVGMNGATRPMGMSMNMAPGSMPGMNGQMANSASTGGTVDPRVQQQLQMQFRQHMNQTQNSLQAQLQQNQQAVQQQQVLNQQQAGMLRTPQLQQQQQAGGAGMALAGSQQMVPNQSQMQNQMQSANGVAPATSVPSSTSAPPPQQMVMNQNTIQQAMVALQNPQHPITQHLHKAFPNFSSLPMQTQIQQFHAVYVSARFLPNGG